LLRGLRLNLSSRLESIRYEVNVDRKDDFR